MRWLIGFATAFSVRRKLQESIDERSFLGGMLPLRRLMTEDPSRHLRLGRVC